MKDDTLLNDLSEMREDFASGFSDRVFNQLRNPKTDRVIRMWSVRASIAAAASVALVIVMTYATYGRFNADALTGIDGFSNIELSEGLDSYAFYNE